MVAPWQLILFGVHTSLHAKRWIHAKEAGTISKPQRFQPERGRFQDTGNSVYIIYIYIRSKPFDSLDG